MCQFGTVPIDCDCESWIQENLEKEMVRRPPHECFFLKSSTGIRLYR